MNLSIESIEAYLSEVRSYIRKGKYQIERNRNRADNNALFINYLLDEKTAEKILLSLTPYDFSEVRQNEKAGYEHELLYIFGKDVDLVERFGSTVKTISLYIKFNKIENYYLFVISFHEQKYPMKYYFDRT